MFNRVGKVAHPSLVITMLAIVRKSEKQSYVSHYCRVIRRVHIRQGIAVGSNPVLTSQVDRRLYFCTQTRL